MAPEDACFLPASTSAPSACSRSTMVSMVSTRNHSELRPYRLHRQNAARDVFLKILRGLAPTCGAATTVAKHADAIGRFGSVRQLDRGLPPAKADRQFVLERGRRYATNDFPRDATDIDALFWRQAADIRRASMTCGSSPISVCVVAAGRGRLVGVRQHPHSSGPGGVRRSRVG